MLRMLLGSQADWSQSSIHFLAWFVGRIWTWRFKTTKHNYETDLRTATQWRCQIQWTFSSYCATEESAIAPCGINYIWTWYQYICELLLRKGWGWNNVRLTGWSIAWRRKAGFVGWHDTVVKEVFIKFRKEKQKMRAKAHESQRGFGGVARKYT